MLRARDATPDDHAVACEFWAAFGGDQQPPDAADWNARFRANTMFLVNEAGEILGYAVCMPYGARGDIRHIMVAPAWRGRGIGREVMEAVRERLRAAGCTNWRLEVRDDNAPGVALYRRCGMSVLHTLVTLRMTRAMAEPLASTCSNSLSVREIDPVDDARLETRFDLGAGQLARCRTVASSKLWRIDDDALAHFRSQLAPGLSLFFPFRAATPDHAAHLMAAAVAFGMAEQLELLVVGDEAAAPFLAAGATSTERMLEMGGAL